MRRLFLILAVVTACSKPAPGPVAPTQPDQPPRAPSLLDHVPHDTPFLLSANGSSFTGARVHDMIEQMRAGVQPTLAAIDDDMIAEMKPEERIWFVVLKAMATVSAEDMARLGMDPARVEFALYTRGLTPVGRLRLDGPFLRDLVARSLKDAGLDYPSQRFGAHEYWTWTGKAGLQIVAVILDDQLVVALTRDPEAILPHLVGDATGRPEHPFELATISARYPQLRGEPVIFLDPQRLAAIVDRVEPVRDFDPSITAACAHAAAGLLRTFPGIAATTSEPDRKTRVSRFVIGPSPAMTKALGAMIRPIPRWPTGEPGEHEAVYGMGVAPLPLLEALAEYADESLAALRVCGGEAPAQSMRDSIGVLAPVLGPMNGSTFVIHEIDEHEAMPLQVEVFADVTDPYAIYSFLASNLGLPPRPPTLGTPTEVSLGFLPATIVLEARAIAGTFGRHDPAALDKLRKAPAGPRILARITMGPGVADSNPHGISIMEMTIEDDMLLLDMIEKAQGE